MRNGVASTERNGLSAVALMSLVVSCFLVGSCETTKVLTDAIVNSCGTGTAYLSGWYSGVPESQITYDPIGGYELAFWIDDANNVCHGNPGTNGQPGVAVIKAVRPGAEQLARNNSFVTMEQLKDFQEIPVSFDHYAGSGFHFVQFVAILARMRNDGTAAKFPGLNGPISIPNVIEVGKNSCIAPVALRVNDPPLPLPVFPEPPVNSQDPDKCKARALPRELAMSKDDREKYDSGLFAHGTEIYEVL